MALLNISICLMALAWVVGCATKSPQSPTLKPATSAPSAVTAAPQAQTPPPEQPDPALKRLAEATVTSFDGEGWQPLFDGHSLTGWRETQFSGHGETVVTDGLILLKMGDPFTGIGLTNDFPTMNYEVALDAARVNGADFFCGLTVPVKDSFCSLIVGGWGGALVGISSLDGMDASENETSKYVTFKQNHWYRIRMRVTEGRIEAWIDSEKLIDVVTTDKKISLRPGEIEESKPFGIASWQTTSALRQVQVRRVSEAADKPKKQY